MLARVRSKILRFGNPDTGVLTGDLAETWETPDPTTLVLNLRDGVNWHADGPGANHLAAAVGRALTTEDIVWNIDRQRNKLLQSGEEAGNFGRSSCWGGVSSIDQVDSSVSLNLVEPDATFVQGFANEFNLINQPELVGGTEDQYTEVDASKVIGTGPNILTRWDPGEGIAAIKNPDFYGNPTQPYLDAWVWVQTFQDPNAYRIAFEQKQVDSMTDPDPNTILAIHDDLVDETYLSFQGVANTVVIFAPSNKSRWNDLRLTRAIDLAINRRQLIQQLHKGLGKVFGPVSGMQEAWTISQEDLENIPGYRVYKDADVEEARALWNAAGGPELGQIDWVTSELWASRATWSATPGIIAEMFNQAFDTDQFIRPADPADCRHAAGDSVPRARPGLYPDHGAFRSECGLMARSGRSGDYDAADSLGRASGARKRVRGGSASGRRERPTNHDPSRAAELRGRADHCVQYRHRRVHPCGSVDLVPRRRTAGDSKLGPDGPGRARIAGPAPVADSLRGRCDHADRVGLQPARRCAARRARSSPAGRLGLFARDSARRRNMTMWIGHKAYQ